MTTRLQQHLREAHGSEDQGSDPAWLHKALHRQGGLRHDVDDLYLAIDEDGDTSDPDEVVE